MSGATAELPLFPLRLVLFPGALLRLKVFEARYLDLVSRCLREGSGFGVVCLREGGEVRSGAETVRFEDAGTLARLDEVDAAQPGILQVRCTGTRRFELTGSARQRDDGLWVAPVRELPDDPAVAPTPAMHATVRALANAIGALAQQGTQPFAAPHRFDDAGWVANRWCELLPVPLAAKHKLMLLDDPLVRLQLVDEFLRQRGVVGG
ncbi:LON peptidase substrate-binding domain-containing protein [Calidifontimicrobium sp. SYSU G02091]|uniref:LON peptidase substrate-binding domain-containing protein n=1 Tax=Calidifontimicrobium sp. SYSU G02091 TaxID=2926421 RepID=UPI001F534971|nr:LON peptidase substrate-binding domain-containing protein [Calidifontimicrobium sp. SYSU G02091]